ncbi:MAG TPA: methyltransferase domain-containing protein [Dehalococcoidia bacterium]|nr:methyltransferase domain-containing protein [Dehalococcoidia bacterium]
MLTNCMKPLDRYLQKVRIRRAQPFIRHGDVVLDVGCADGTMFENWRGLIKHGIGIDPIVELKQETELYTLYPGIFPHGLPDGVKCDVITMLAVLEHLPPDAQAELPEACYRHLNDGGRVVITVPSPQVDYVLDLLSAVHLIDGMSLHEHYGFEAEDTLKLFAGPCFKLLQHHSFQLGLNNLFVFEKV